MIRRKKCTYGYDEFGNDLYSNQGVTQPFGYTGYQIDSISNTYFAQAREYKSDIGRFAGEDWIKGNIVSLPSMNPYIYCLNNSIGLRDLNGKFPSLEDIEDWFIDGIYNVATVVDKYRIPIFVGGVLTLGAVTGGAAWGVITIPGETAALSSGALMGGVVGGAGNWIISGQNWDHLINGFAGGMISGIGMSSGLGFAIIGGALGSEFNTLVEEDKITLKKILVSALIGAVSAGVGYGLSEKVLGKSIYNDLIKDASEIDKKIIKLVFEYLKMLYDVTLESIWNTLSTVCDE
ncbi:MAG: hypothetical protein IKS48_04010 [Eubacterium sp.]|nr:hypothetical protein [Eubacterium sp.]